MNSKKWIDLHLHTLASDGTFTAQEVLEKAREAHFSAVAITDHDSVRALEEARFHGEKFGIEVISGIELSAYHAEQEVHILGYFFDDKNVLLLEKLKEFQSAREKRIHAIVKKLQEIKINISLDDVFKLVGDGAAGRLHVARVLYEKGIVTHPSEAFKRFLSYGKPAYVPKEKISTWEAIDMIRKAGGIASLAHPVFLPQEKLIASFVQEGLQAIEVYHPEHSSGVTDHYRKMAIEHGLLMTGGSDCHGLAKGKMLIGSVRTPYELLEPLKKRALN
ncbi:MAG: PHP domain-containing protein [Chlamydiae bacterium]|nr:PHP domain-containing protein [Chlamydiota bacterium]MBI3267153.1 PHP domain-containing protein [Chlamydiota bacterium]